MSKVIVREDGWTEIYQNPSDYVKQLPTYSDWSELLKDRGCETSGNSHVWLRSKVSGKLRAETITQVAHLDSAGNVKLMCIGCGLLWSRLDMNNIVIGGLIRLPDEQQTGPKEITIKEKAMPVSKRGLGCPPCQDRFMVAILKINAENERRQKIATLKARIALMKAKDSPEYLDKNFKLKAITFPSMLSAWLDVFEGENNV